MNTDEKYRKLGHILLSAVPAPAMFIILLGVMRIEGIGGNGYFLWPGLPFHVAGLPIARKTVKRNSVLIHVGVPILLFVLYLGIWRVLEGPLTSNSIWIVALAVIIFILVKTIRSRPRA